MIGEGATFMHVTHSTPVVPGGIGARHKHQGKRMTAIGIYGSAGRMGRVIAAIAGGFSVIARRTEDPRILDVARHGAEAATRGAALVRQLLSFARQQAMECARVSRNRLGAERSPSAAIRSARRTASGRE